MFKHLFRRNKQPEKLPPVEDTIYMRGNRWFAYNPHKWMELGYSDRVSHEIYKHAKTIAADKNLEIAKARPPNVPAAPVPQREDSRKFVDYLIDEEIATIASKESPLATDGSDTH